MEVEDAADKLSCGAWRLESDEPESGSICVRGSVGAVAQ